MHFHLSGSHGCIFNDAILADGPQAEDVPRYLGQRAPRRRCGVWHVGRPYNEGMPHVR